MMNVYLFAFLFICIPDKIFDLETANRGLEESITSCKSSSWELQQKLTSSKEHASSLDQSLSFCVQVGVMSRGVMSRGVMSYMVLS